MRSTSHDLRSSSRDVRGTSSDGDRCGCTHLRSTSDNLCRPSCNLCSTSVVVQSCTSDCIRSADYDLCSFSRDVRGTGSNGDRCGCTYLRSYELCSASDIVCRTSSNLCCQSGASYLRSASRHLCSCSLCRLFGHRCPN